MYNYDVIVDIITKRLFGNLFWIIILGVLAIYFIVLLIKSGKKIKERKYVKMDRYLIYIVVCLVLLCFIVMFSILMFINLSARTALIKDNQEQQTFSKEIALGYSEFSSKHITFVIDEKNEDDRYYFIDYLPGIDEVDINQGDKYIISYFKYSKVIFAVEPVD